MSEIHGDIRAIDAEQVIRWLQGERAYQVNKFGYETDDAHTREAYAEDNRDWHRNWYVEQAEMYLHRSIMLGGPETPGGRQAIAKAVATLCGLLESVVHLYGDLPAPGQSSGNVEMASGTTH